VEPTPSGNDLVHQLLGDLGTRVDH
jgi:hypothetical protein